MDKYLFIDFDGVTHRCSASEAERFEKAPLIERYLRAHPDVRAVFATSWRESCSLEELRAFFAVDVRSRFIDVTPSLRQRPGARYREIQAWLRRRGASHAKWVALDDSPALYPEHCPHLVQCDPERAVGHQELAKAHAMFCRAARHLRCRPLRGHKPAAAH